MSSSFYYKKILLFLSIVLLFLVLAELTLRLGNYKPINELLWVDLAVPDSPIEISEDAILGYQFKKNITKVWYVPSINLTKEVQTNSLGMRDYEYSKSKSDDVFRILVLGDSVTAGSLVSYTNQTYPKKLEYLLNEQSKNKIEVLNAGVDGYNTIQESRYFVTKGLELDPDIVIVGYVIENDFSETEYVALFNNETNRLEYYNNNVKYFKKPKFNKLLVTNSYLMRFLNNKLIEIFNFSNGVEELFLGEEKFINSIVSIKQEADKKEIKVVFVLFPTLNDDDLLSERKFIKEILDSENIIYLDLFESIRSYDYELLKAAPNDYVHPNEFGYDIIANEIYDFFIENELCLECG